MVPFRPQQVGHQALEHEPVAVLEEVSVVKAHLRMEAGIALVEPELRQRPSVQVGLMERALPEDHRPVRAERIKLASRQPPMFVRLVAKRNEPVVLVGLRRQPRLQEPKILLRRVRCRQHFAIRHAPWFGRDDLHRREQRPEERVQVVVDEARQDHLVPERQVDDHLAALLPGLHCRHVAHRHNARTDHAHRGRQRQRLVHRVEALRDEDPERLHPGATPRRAGAACPRG